MSTILRITVSGALALVAVSSTVANAAQQVAPAAGRPLPIYTEWKSYTTADGLPSDKVLCVLATADDVWAGTEGGLARLHDGTWRTYTKKDGLAYDAVSSLAMCKETGDLWIGTLGGLSRWSAERIDSFTQLSSGLINDVIYGVATVGRDVWVATASGVSVYHPDTKRWELYNHENTVMHEPWCYGLTSSAEHVWVAVWGGGVVEHDPARGTWKAYRDPDGEMEIDLVRDDGVVSDVISAVSYDAGILWVSTYFGLSRYDGRSWRGYLEHESPLPSNFINSLRAFDGWVWAATDKGLAACDGERWVVYNRATDRPGGVLRIQRDAGEPELRATSAGLAHDFAFSVWPERDRVWVATARGLSVGSRAPAAANGDATPGGTQK